jgi:hypothetical protein
VNEQARETKQQHTCFNLHTAQDLLLFFWLKFKSVEIWFFLCLLIEVQWSFRFVHYCCLLIQVNEFTYVSINLLLLGLYPCTQLLHVLHLGDRVSQKFADNNIIWFRKIYSFQ